MSTTNPEYAKLTDQNRPGASFDKDENTSSKDSSATANSYQPINQDQKHISGQMGSSSRQQTNTLRNFSDSNAAGVNFDTGKAENKRGFRET